MLKRSKGVVGFWALVCLAGVTVEARQWPSMEWVEYENALTIEFPTPHTRWAKPYALGSVKVLFFGHKDNQKWMIWGPGTRYAAELIQRFDVEGDAVLVDPEVGPPNPKYSEEPGVYGGELGRRRLSRLLATPFDCFVFGREDLSSHLPDVSRKKVLQAVRDGAGLVLYGQIDEALCNGLTALDETPAFLAGLDVDCFTLGKGRVVAFRPGTGICGIVNRPRSSILPTSSEWTWPWTWILRPPVGPCCGPPGVPRTWCFRLRQKIR